MTAKILCLESAAPPIHVGWLLFNNLHYPIPLSHAPNLRALKPLTPTPTIWVWHFCPLISPPLSSAFECHHYPEPWRLGFLTPYPFGELIQFSQWTLKYTLPLHIQFALDNPHKHNIITYIWAPQQHAFGGYKAHMSFGMSGSYPYILWPSPDPLTPDPWPQPQIP